MNINDRKQKKREEKFGFYNSQKYPIYIKQEKNKFYLLIKELSLVSESENLDEGYKDIEKQKTDMIYKLIDCGEEENIRLPQRRSQYIKTISQLKMFLYKLIIVSVLAIIVLTVSGALLANKISQISFVDIMKTQTKAFFVQAQKNLVNAPEDVKNRRIESAKKIVQSLQPIIKEFQDLNTSVSTNDIKEKKGKKIQ